MQNSKCLNRPFLVREIKFCVKKCVNFNFSEIGFQTLECSYGSAGIGQSHTLEEVVSGQILVLLPASVERIGVSRIWDFFSALF